MKTWLGIRALIVTCVAVVVASCGDTSTEPVVTGGRKPVTAPSRLEATSINEGTVGLRWTSSDTSVTAFVVRCSAVSGADSARSVRITDRTATTASVAGLKEGVIYSFTVSAIRDSIANGSVVLSDTSAASSAVQWAPARRGSGVYRLYSSQSADTALGQGLAIFRASGVPAVLSTANGGEWDICFDDTDPTNPRFGAPGQSGYVDAASLFPNGQKARMVMINDNIYINVNSLDDIYESTALSVLETDNDKMFPLNIHSLPLSSNGIAFVVATMDVVSKQYNFAKVLLKKQSNGGFVAGSGASAYIEVEISYQTMRSVPHALRMKFDEAVIRSSDGQSRSADR